MQLRMCLPASRPDSAICLLDYSDIDCSNTKNETIRDKAMKNRNMNSPNFYSGDRNKFNPFSEVINK